MIIAVAALFANAVPYLLFAAAEQTVDSSTAGIINATTPLWTVLLALAIRHQKTVTSWQAAGLIIGCIGAVLIFTPWRTTSALISAGGLECRHSHRLGQLRHQLHLHGPVPSSTLLGRCQGGEPVECQRLGAQGAGAEDDGEHDLQLAQDLVEGHPGAGAFGSDRSRVQKAWARTARVTWRCQPI